jgi:hypothetical protein
MTDGWNYVGTKETRRRIVKKAIELLDNEKFIVINRKRFKELNDTQKKDDGAMFKSHSAALKLEMALYNFVRTYEKETGKQLDQKYIVCNQDEPYADKVARLVLGGKPRWETPEQWEKRTGEPWPDDWAVYVRLPNDAREKRRIYDCYAYKTAKELKSSHPGTELACATEAGPPPNNWRPEEAE